MRVVCVLLYYDVRVVCGEREKSTSVASSLRGPAKQAKSYGEWYALRQNKGINACTDKHTSLDRSTRASSSHHWHRNNNDDAAAGGMDDAATLAKLTAGQFGQSINGRVTSG
jgi:hypothetical protein